MVVVQGVEGANAVALTVLHGGRCDPLEQAADCFDWLRKHSRMSDAQFAGYLRERAPRLRDWATPESVRRWRSGAAPVYTEALVIAISLAIQDGVDLRQLDNILRG